jgi:hypothetical protein
MGVVGGKESDSTAKAAAVAGIGAER